MNKNFISYETDLYIFIQNVQNLQNAYDMCIKFQNVTFCLKNKTNLYLTSIFLQSHLQKFYFPETE